MQPQWLCFLCILVKIENIRKISWQAIKHFDNFLLVLHGNACTTVAGVLGIHTIWTHCLGSSSNLAMLTLCITSMREVLLFGITPRVLQSHCHVNLTALFPLSLPIFSCIALLASPIPRSKFGAGGTHYTFLGLRNMLLSCLLIRIDKQGVNILDLITDMRTHKGVKTSAYTRFKCKHDSEDYLSSMANGQLHKPLSDSDVKAIGSDAPHDSCQVMWTSNPALLAWKAGWGVNIKVDIISLLIAMLMTTVMWH